MKCPNENVSCIEDSFEVISSPAVTHTQHQTRKGRSPLAEQLFGMYNICLHHILFELCVTEKYNQKEKEKMTKIGVFMWFLDLDKG